MHNVPFPSPQRPRILVQVSHPSPPQLCHQLWQPHTKGAAGLLSLPQSPSVR